MKLGLFLILAGFLAQANMKGDFNQAMRENISQVIKNNPEKFENRDPGRHPASVAPERPRVHEFETEREQMDSLQRQGIGLPKW